MNNEMENEVYEEEDRIFEVEAEDGTVEKLYHIATIEYRGGMYCCFQKAEPESEEEEDEVIIFALKGEGDEAMLEPLEDEQLLDEVFAEFCHQYEDFENSEEAEDGTIEKLYHIATIEYRGGMYCCFQKAEPECEEEEDEVIIFALKGEGDDAVLEPLEDEQLLDEVFAEFCHQYENFENSDEAESLED